jgi:WD40 repeat protein/DNA-binding XRE family transcriptional regulator
MHESLEFGPFVKRRRKELDLTQLALAEELGYSVDTIKKIEAGTLRPSRQLADLLAQALDVPPAERQNFVRSARMPNVPRPESLPSETAPTSVTPGAASGPVITDVPAQSNGTPVTPPADGLRIESLQPYVDHGDDIQAHRGQQEPANPYKGLRAFHEADAPDFFGREALSQRLRARLDEPTELARFLAVVGPSGSGKSSVVRAGLVPALRHQSLPGGLNPVMVDMIPGSRPLEELEAALLRVAINPPSSLMEQLQADERGLARAVKRVLPGDDHTQLVLVIDQFEELFTLVEDEKARADFLDSLFSAVTDPRSRLWVVITLRADFYDRPLLYLPSSELLGRRTEVVGPLTPHEMYEAIAGPAERVGLELERDLAATIMQDVAEQPGTLPLLQYTLTELYERREGRLLTVAAYRASGGVFGSLALRAESLYRGLTEPEQAAARQLFLRLVTLGEGIEDTRRRVLMSELISVAEAGAKREDGEAKQGDGALHRVLDLFGRYRMLTFDRNPLTREPTVEVAHEALLRSWGRLRDWLDESRESLHVQRRLMTSAAEWQASGKQPSYLASGSRLAQFEGLATHAADSGGVALTVEERAYLAASQEDERRQEKKEQERQTRESVLQKRAASRLRYLASGLAIFLIVAALLTVLALSRQAEAQANLTRAEAQSLAAAASNLVQTNGSAELIALLALRSIGTQYSPQGDAALEAAATLEYPRQNYVGQTAQINRVSVSRDGRYVLSAAFEGRLMLWDATTGEKLHELVGHQISANGGFTPDGRYVVSWGKDKTIRVWDVETGEELRQYPIPMPDADTTWGGAVSPDGKRVLISSSDKVLREFDVQTGKLLFQFPTPEDTSLGISYSPDGRFIFVGGKDKIGRLWDAQTGLQVQAFTGHTEQIYRAAFSPDGKYVLTGSSDKTARLWDVQTGQQVHVFSGHTDAVFGVAYSPDGKFVLTGGAGDDRTAILWDAQSGQEVRRFKRRTSEVTSVAYSPDGKYVLTGGSDGTLVAWNVRPNTGLPQLVGHTGAVASVEVSRDGKYVLTGSRDKTARLWEVQTGEELRQYLGHTNQVRRAAFSPNGTYILTASDDGTARLWDTQTARQVLTFTGHMSTIYDAIFSPDGKYALTGSNDFTARLWDVRTGQQVHLLASHTNQVLSVAISAGGEYALTGSLDTTARLWDLQTGKEVRQYTGNSGGAGTVGFLPDGKHVFIGSQTGTIRILDMKTGEVIRQFLGTYGRFSPDGKYALTSATDNTARLWDAATGAELRRFSDPAGAVNGVTFSHDSKYVLTANTADTKVRLWNTDYHDTIRYLCETLLRDFTDAERAQFGISDKEPTCPKP